MEDIGLVILCSLGVMVILILGAGLFYLGAKITKVKKLTFVNSLQAYFTCIVINIAVSAVTQIVGRGILLLGVILSAYLQMLYIKRSFETELSKAALIWLFYMVVMILFGGALIILEHYFRYSLMP